jgi:hypothetical protein
LDIADATTSGDAGITVSSGFKNPSLDFLDRLVPLKSNNFLLSDITEQKNILFQLIFSPEKLTTGTIMVEKPRI